MSARPGGNHFLAAAPTGIGRNCPRLPGSIFPEASVGMFLYSKQLMESRNYAAGTEIEDIPLNTK